MGYRERQAHRQQQKQQALGQPYQAEQRVTIPAPRTMNSRDNPADLSQDHAVLLENAIPVDGGLLITDRPQPEAILSSTSAGNPQALITYTGSASASTEFWAIAQSKIYNIKEQVGVVIPATASITYTAAAGVNPFSWTQYNKTIIAVNGIQSLKWNRASAWGPWSATASGDDINNFIGITRFKNRLIGWASASPVLWYGSTDQVLGTFNPFDLSSLISSNIKIVHGMTNDGGAGPDDYLLVISESGEVAVYAGTDPADANNWSLVGVYKIGTPLSKNSIVQHGQQTVVLCEDDFYFLPSDFSGKKQGTVAAERRVKDQFDFSDGIFYEKEGLLIFSEGSVLSANKGYAYSTIHLSSASPPEVRLRNDNTGTGVFARRPRLCVYDGNVYTLARKDDNSALMTVDRVFPDAGLFLNRKTKSRIKTSPIKISGRSNISLVNPVFNTEPVGSASTSSEFIYRTAILYDKEGTPYVSASANAYLTTTASATSKNQWTPGFGTGDYGQVLVEVLSASTSSELFLTRIDLTISDTGGI